MAGKGPELLVSPTDDMGKILSSLHGVPIHGKANFAAAVHIAQVTESKVKTCHVGVSNLRVEVDRGCLPVSPNGH